MEAFLKEHLEKYVFVTTAKFFYVGYIHAHTDGVLVLRDARMVVYTGDGNAVAQNIHAAGVQVGEPADRTALPIAGLLEVTLAVDPTTYTKKAKKRR